MSLRPEGSGGAKAAKREKKGLAALGKKAPKKKQADDEEVSLALVGIILALIISSVSLAGTGVCLCYRHAQLMSIRKSCNSFVILVIKHVNDN